MINVLMYCIDILYRCLYLPFLVVQGMHSFGVVFIFIFFGPTKTNDQHREDHRLLRYRDDNKDV